eukprot:2604407-Lingulodinium_polyedra.AAC.1
MPARRWSARGVVTHFHLPSTRVYVISTRARAVKGRPRKRVLTSVNLCLRAQARIPCPVGGCAPLRPGL